MMQIGRIVGAWAIAAALLAGLQGDPARAASCLPATTPNSPGTTSQAQLEVLVALCNNGPGAAPSAATGAAVPSWADYLGLNVAGTLRGWTGVNPSGSIYAAQVDIASFLGAVPSASNPFFTAPQVSGDIIVAPSASFARPGDTNVYASGDLVANNTTAGSVVPLSWTASRIAAGNFYIRRVRMTLSSKSVTNTSFRVHFFSATTTVSNGDNGVFVPTTAANWVCAMDVSVILAGADVSVGAGSPNVGGECNVTLASGQTLYGLIEARAAYTPASGETIAVIPEIHQN